MIEELTRSGNSWADSGDVDSIYFGGGTPSLIPAEHIAELLASCHRLLCVTEDCEVSLEANPDTVSPDKVTRISGRALIAFRSERSRSMTGNCSPSVGCTRRK